MTQGRDGFTGSGSVCYGAGTMVLAGIFGAILFLLLLIGDWYQFTSLGPFSAQYGFGIARRHDRLDTLTRQALVRQFGRHDVIALPHGVARWFAAQEVISLRPSYQLFSMRFRTAWPLKGTITLRSTEAGVELSLTKRVPWSSGVLTLIWLGLVTIGTVGLSGHVRDRRGVRFGERLVPGPGCGGTRRLGLAFRIDYGVHGLSA